MFWQSIYHLLISPSTIVECKRPPMQKWCPLAHVEDTKDKSGNKSSCLHCIGEFWSELTYATTNSYIISSNTCSSSSNRVQRRLEREAQGLQQPSTYHTKISAVSIVYYTWQKQDSPATHTHTYYQSFVPACKTWVWEEQRREPITNPKRRVAFVFWLFLCCFNKFDGI